MPPGEAQNTPGSWESSQGSWEWEHSVLQCTGCKGYSGNAQVLLTLTLQKVIPPACWPCVQAYFVGNSWECASLLCDGIPRKQSSRGDLSQHAVADPSSLTIVLGKKAVLIYFQVWGKTCPECTKWEDLCWEVGFACDVPVKLSVLLFHNSTRILSFGKLLPCAAPTSNFSLVLTVWEWGGSRILRGGERRNLGTFP